MKKRTSGFIAEDKIAHDSEIFDYIRELHDYLWRFVRRQLPGASGSLRDFLDRAVDSREIDKDLPINIVFDGPPGPESGRFVEVETDDRKSLQAGEWIEKNDGYWVLRISALPKRKIKI